MRRNTVWLAFLLFIVHFVIAAASAQNVPLYVDNSEGDDVSVIDLKTLNAVDDIRLADKVHGLAIQADGKQLFASIESDNTLRVVDTATDKVIATIKLTGRPNECAVTPDGHYVAVPNPGQECSGYCGHAGAEGGENTPGEQATQRVQRWKQSLPVRERHGSEPDQRHRPHDDGVLGEGDSRRNPPALRRDSRWRNDVRCGNRLARFHEGARREWENAASGDGGRKPHTEAASVRAERHLDTWAGALAGLDRALGYEPAGRQPVRLRREGGQDHGAGARRRWAELGDVLAGWEVCVRQQHRDK